MKKAKILSIGEIIWDIYPNKKTIGGAPLNFSAHSVLCGAESTLISAIGNDPLGEEALIALKDFGVNCKYIKKSEKSTGQCIVTLDNNAIPHYNVLRNVAYDDIRLDQADFEDIQRERYDAFYFGTLIQREETARKAVHALVEKCQFPNILCDVNLRPDCYDKTSVDFCLKHATILKVSIEEEPLLRVLGDYIPENNSAQSIAEALSNAYPQLEVIILTLGKDGSFAYTVKDKAAHRQSAIGDKVVSTVGAGDSFSAAWLTSYLSKKPMDECMKKAAEVSGFVVAHTQAVPLY